MEYAVNIILILFFVLLNAFFVAAEFALVSVRKTRIEELAKKGSKIAQMIQKALNNIDTYLSTTQFGITSSNLILGWISEPFLARLIRPFFSFLPENIAFISSHGLSVVATFILITFTVIVMSELVPKNIALQHAELVTSLVIVPLSVFARVFSPFIWILNRSGNFVLRLLHLSPNQGSQTFHSEEEIRMILSQSSAMGTIEKEEVEMVENIFRLGDIPVKQIMIPRTNVVAFNINVQLKEIVNKTSKRIHSRFPIYEKSIENVVGFVHVKDVYKMVIKKENLEKRLLHTNIIREILTVPETKKVDEVLLDMRRKWIHIAVVKDEYGGTAGIVTLEDIIESVVGEIEDEFEKHVRPIQRQADGSYLIDGLVAVENVQKRFNLPIRGLGYTTIGGLIFGFLGKQPEAGDTIQIGTITLEVVRLSKKRVKIIRLRKEVKSKKKVNA